LEIGAMSAPNAKDRKPQLSRQRIILIVMALVLLTPIAFCCLVLAVCTSLGW
jgi:hypothetical protein